MINQAKQVVDSIGLSNLISIILFIISIFIAFYFYFKSFYRIVYSTQSICKRNNDFIDWNNKNIEKTTRLIFYNNGRKTITNDEIKIFKIKTRGKILNTYVLEGINHFDFEKSENELEIIINSLDTSKYFVLEISHTGFLNIKGEISETGSFLQTETRTWLIINILFILFVFISLGYNVLTYLNPIELKMTDYKILGLNIALVLILAFFIRYIHKVFFISDNLINKYLSTKDKWNKEFNDYYY